MVALEPTHRWAAADLRMDPLADVAEHTIERAASSSLGNHLEGVEAGLRPVIDVCWKERSC